MGGGGGGRLFEGGVFSGPYGIYMYMYHEYYMCTDLTAG